MSSQHPNVTELLGWFEHSHLPQHLAVVSEWFAIVARNMVREIPDGGLELEAGLRKLLEAKDCAVCAVRARIRQERKEIATEDPAPPEVDPAAAGPPPTTLTEAQAGEAMQRVGTIAAQALEAAGIEISGMSAAVLMTLGVYGLQGDGMDRDTVLAFCGDMWDTAQEESGG